MTTVRKRGQAGVEPPTYWALMWREGDDWGWLWSLDGMESCTTQDPGRRLRYRTHEAAMAALWRFRRDNPKRPREVVRVVKVTVKVAS